MPDVTDDSSYIIFSHEGDDIAGLMQIGRDVPYPPQWLVYIETDSIVKTIGKAEKLGGNIIMAVTEIPGRGKDGSVTVMTCSVQRKEVRKIEALVREVDKSAFITTEDVVAVRRGFWGA